MSARNPLLFAVLLAALVPAPALAAAPPPAAAAEAPTPAGGMVFVANTGLEDLGTLTSSLRHAIGAKRSGHLEEVVWIVYGRAIVVLDPTVGAVPEDVRALVAQARAAGVRLVACEQALEKFAIPIDQLPDGVETVPNALSEIARLVSEGFALLRY